ncbi:MAG TPA: SapC family protein [Rhodopila sp.]|nr:SapC family protein [Rhodopila sp.]
MLLSGFQAVSRARLAALPGNRLAELTGSGELELLYLHLQSLNNFEALKDRLVAIPLPTPQPAGVEPVA